MSAEERKTIMDALNQLPEEGKQFVLGYAAGRAASSAEKKMDPAAEESGSCKEQRSEKEGSV